MKNIYRAMQKGKHYGNNRDLTSEQISWWTENGINLGKMKRNVFTEEEYREAYLLWKKENPEEKNVPQSAKVILPNGKEINLGTRINKMKCIYKAMQRGEHFQSNKDLTSEQISWWTGHGFNFEKEKSYTKSQGNQVKKVKKQQNIKPKEKKQQDVKNKKDLLLEFQIDSNEFIRTLGAIRIKKTDSNSFHNIEEQTLHNFCLHEGYKYPVVSKAIKLYSFLKEETLEQLINRVLVEQENKQEISPWIFEVYGPLVKEILEKLDLNSEQVLSDISKSVIPIEKAICRYIFQTTCKKAGCSYLEDIYEKIITKIDFQSSEEENSENIVKKIIKIGKKEHLLKDETDALKKGLYSYLRVMREYQIMDAGLELIEEEKLKKIRKYNLTEEEIEESYFVPFYFEEGILLGEKSELYRRRELLRQYIIDWDYYTEEEKLEAKEEQHFTEEEFSIIEKTRSEINETVSEIQKIKK